MTQYKPFFNYLNSAIASSSESVIVEEGSGTGLVSSLIPREDKQLILVDNNVDMLRLSDRNVTGKNVKRVLCDLTRFSHNGGLVHSHGVLEHLSPGDIQQVIRRQKQCYSRVIHYVPSNRYTYKSFGNELLLSKQQWVKLVHPDKVIEFNNGYDLILSWGG